jgi:hypothetical protein
MPQTAVHEAGQAVFARVLGLRVVGVAIEEQGERGEILRVFEAGKASAAWRRFPSPVPSLSRSASGQRSGRRGSFGTPGGETGPSV